MIGRKYQRNLRKYTEGLLESKILSSKGSRQLKILILVDAWFPHVGGGQIHVWELSKKLADLGCKITILTRNLGFSKEKYKGIEIKKVGLVNRFDNLYGRLEYLFLAIKYILLADYDILHAHAFSPGLIVPIIKIFKKKPSVFTVHGIGFKIAGLGITGRFLQDFVFYKIPYDLEITVAKKTIYKKTAAKKVLVIPNGVNIKMFSKAIRVRKKITKLLFVGRLVIDKGADLLLQAFLDLNDNDLQLVIVGEGKQKNSLQKQFKKKNIVFKGLIQGESLIEEYKNADLLVMPSRVEGQPIRLLEAWSAKLPVLATRTGDNTIFIKDSINGFLCNPSVQSIEKKLKKIILMNDFTNIVDKGYKEVKNYSWDIIAFKTMNEYRSLTLSKDKINV